jgi:hypothetical protein
LIGFETWIKHVFDHPLPQTAADVAWHYQMDAEYVDLAPALTVEYLIRLFEDIDAQCAPYSDAQVDQGINYLIMPSSSDYMFALSDPGVDIARRILAVNLIFSVYEKLYARRCDRVMSSGQFEDNETNPLNYTCYMWWDIIPLYASRGFPPNITQYLPRYRAKLQLNDAVFDVMERTLTLDHVACQEAALHGLGHWYLVNPNRVKTIIDRFLETKKSLSPELQAYAHQARLGTVQ